jgi:hypothetical protein
MPGRVSTSFVQARLRTAAGRLTAIESLSHSGRVAARPQAIGLDARGAATAVWVQINAPTRASRGHTAITVAVRPPGGRFGAPVEIGPAGANNDIGLAVAPDGAAVITRQSAVGVTMFRRAAGPCPAASARACFGPPRVVYRCDRRASHGAGCFSGHHTPYFRVVLGPTGTAYLSWPGHVVVTDGRRPGRAVTIPLGDEQGLALLPDGSAVVAWLAVTTRRWQLVKAATIDAGARRATGLQTISLPWRVGGENCRDLRLGANPQGETTLAVECLPVGAEGHRSTVALRPRGGRFGAATAISPVDLDTTSSVLAVDSRGDAILAYAAGGSVVARVRRPGIEAFDAATPIGVGAPSQAVVAGAGVSILWPGSLAATTGLADWAP